MTFQVGIWNFQKFFHYSVKSLFVTLTGYGAIFQKGALFYWSSYYRVNHCPFGSKRASQSEVVVLVQRFGKELCFFFKERITSMSIAHIPVVCVDILLAHLMSLF